MDHAEIIIMKAKLAAAVVVLLAGAGVAAILYRRRVKVAPSPSSPSLVSFQCIRCKRGLKGKASHLGHKVKCPGCGEITPVSLSPARK